MDPRCIIAWISVLFAPDVVGRSMATIAGHITDHLRSDMTIVDMGRNTACIMDRRRIMGTVITLPGLQDVGRSKIGSASCRESELRSDMTVMATERNQGRMM